MEHTPILANKKKIYRNGRRTFASRSQRKIPRATFTPCAATEVCCDSDRPIWENFTVDFRQCRVQEKTTMYLQYAILNKIKRAPFSWTEEFSTYGHLLNRSFVWRRSKIILHFILKLILLWVCQLLFCGSQFLCCGGLYYCWCMYVLVNK